MADQVFNPGDLVYFRKYEREGVESTFKPGTQATIVEQSSMDGEDGFIIENRKGVRGFVVASELKMRSKPLKEQIREALTKDDKVRKSSRKVEVVEDEASILQKQIQREDDAIIRLMTGADGSAHRLLLTEDLEQVLVNQQTDPLEYARSLWDDVNSTYYALGGALAYIFAEKRHHDYGYTGANAFNRFVDGEIPNMKSRKARYLIEVYVRFTNLGIDKSQVLDLGWTLASNIAAVATPENVHELIAYAKEHGGRALKVFIEENYKIRDSIVEEEVVLRPAEVGKMRHITVSVYQDQFDLYENALEHVKQQYPEYAEKPSQLFAAIITEYASNLAASNGPVTKEDYIRFGQSAYPEYDVLLRNRRTGEVVHPDYNAGEVSITIAPNVAAKAQEQLEAVV